MKTPEQLKGAIRNLAKKKGIHAQEVLQIFMFERIMERLSVSSYKDRFILKGGLLISAILGVAERTTMDMDTTVKGLPMDEQSIRKAISEILAQPVDDGIEFRLLDLTPIREDDEYENFRASIQAVYGKMKIPMKIDITTGDKITPKEIQFSYPFLFDDRRVMVKAYTQETILAEKYETIIRRNVGNTRARDFYDLHLLYRLYRENADWNLLKQAVLATAKKRNSISVLQNTRQILPALKESTVLQDLWKRYQAQNLYAKEITYSEVMETVDEFTLQMNFGQER
ncbi:MAG TPA: nucleotidyl transferase AbiEii/AbiGii toxin family protein [Candidatus Merdiplasma excrementigallinarum]|uniref:Nucleotidyl transferase AbiEii/AbiGii toxin family protein n=1 Tax=Candidatus Merdiplasma excrementigallinarum TaxID=2840864 RepID=A0A9D1NZ57_9FIRM|nr:nucleotidyl transferase AbiEii/AbiGii toxin family protein [Candidatus Merdiplasma excrementigallinarum]